VLRGIAALRRFIGKVGAMVRQEQHYFAGHAGRMDCRGNGVRGWPLGNGVVESACLQRQDRLKRAGLFGTGDGLAHREAR